MYLKFCKNITSFQQATSVCEDRGGFYFYSNLLFINIIKEDNIMKIHDKQSEKERPSFEREELLELIWLDILNGMSRYQIRLKLDRDSYTNQNAEMIKTSDFCRSKKYNLIRDAYNLCEFELKQNKDKMRNVMYQRLLNVYQDSLSGPFPDRRTALETLKYIGKLSGIEEPEKLEINGKVDSEVIIRFGFKTPNDEDKEE